MSEYTVTDRHRKCADEIVKANLYCIEELGDIIAKHFPETDKVADHKGLLDWLESECYDLRCEDVPSFGDDADIIWVVISHHMGKPKERYEGYGKTPERAIRDAMKSKEDPTRWDYVPPEFRQPPTK